MLDHLRRDHFTMEKIHVNNPNPFPVTLRFELFLPHLEETDGHPPSPCTWVQRRQYWLPERFFVIIQHSICTASCTAVMVPNSWQRSDPKSAGHCRGQQQVWFGNLSCLLCRWRSSGSHMLSAVLLLVLDLFLFKVGRSLVPLNTPFYWWKNDSACICEFLP